MTDSVFSVDETESRLNLDAAVPVSDDEIATLRRDIIRHLESLHLPSWANGEAPDQLTKANIRAMHARQRGDVLERERSALGSNWGRLLEHFADGREIRPERIDPELVPVEREGLATALFRFATLVWSVPVSKGYGRRMRYLVRDRSNGKLIGIFSLTDPVFNLRARDEWIDWDVEQRRAGLVHVMDANVVGAVPPYSRLLGGKLIASLLGSAEVSESFARRYAESRGIISGKRKAARLVLVTVTSALGRSSIYNRLKLTTRSLSDLDAERLVELIHVGSTEGYGHFQLSDVLFRRLRDVVARKGHAYANGHKFGEGPNWRIRLLRVGLGMVGLDPDLLRHGIAREVYVMPLAASYGEFLRGEVDEVLLDRPSTREIATAALTRWILPRAARCPDFVDFKRADLLDQIGTAQDLIGFTPAMELSQDE